MGTITGISDLDPVRWPNSHWRSVKVGWDESTAGDRQPRVSLWEIEPLTTFPMYPSLFPLRLKRPWHPGVSSLHDSRDDAANGLMWLRGGTGEQGLQSLNFQSVGMVPWLQQRLDSSLLGSDHNQQMMAAGIQNLGSGDLLRQQMMHLQLPFQYLQQPSCHPSPLQMTQQSQQQIVQQSLHSNVLQPQSEPLAEHLPQHILQQTINNQSEQQPNQQSLFYHRALQAQSTQLHQDQQPNLPSPTFRGTDFMDSSAKLSASMCPRQNMLGSSSPDTGGSFSHFYRGQAAQSEHSSHQTTSKYGHSHVTAHTNFPLFPGRDSIGELGNCNSETPNPIVFGVNIDSSGLLLPTVPNFASPSIDADSSTVPIWDSGFQNSLYGCVQDSSEQVDPTTPTRTFVKVYKSGSVGRSLDISRVNSYHELREELAQMFGIEGKLEDPLRSGWQLVFVDRENDVLLLGDDPWEAFVNNVWYIKILSPEDFQKMGEGAIGSFGPSIGRRPNSNGGEAHSGFPSPGSLEY